MPTRKAQPKSTTKPESKRPGLRRDIFEDGFHADFTEVAFKLALLGAKDEEVANVLGISPRTLARWKDSQPEFAQALQRGKEQADANVAHALYRRAIGYYHDDVDIKVVSGEIVQTTIVKHYPPETVAAIFWLKNRQREKWRDKVETGVTDKDGNDVQVDPMEAARRIAFVLAQGVAAQDAGQPLQPEVKH